MKNKINIWLPLFVMALIIFSLPLKAQTDHWVSAYYAGWQQSTWKGCDDGDLPSDSIDYDALTHIIHFAVLPQPDGTVIWGDTVNSMKECNMDSLVKHTHDAGKKAILCIGGWNTEWIFVSATNPVRRAFFINNLLTLMAAHGYDGVDIDWEPLTEELYGEQYKDFITYLRDSLDARGDYLLTVANGSNPHIYGDGISEDNGLWQYPPAPNVFAQIYQHIDQINLMTYDMSGVWAGWVSWHNAPIYDGGFTFPSNQSKTVPSADSMVQQFINVGIPRSKLGIGIDFYGRDWVGGVADSAIGVITNVPIDQGIHEPRLDWYTEDPFTNTTSEVFPIFDSKGNPVSQWVPVDTTSIIRNGVSLSITQGRWIWIYGVPPDTGDSVPVDSVQGDRIKVAIKHHHSINTPISVEFYPVVYGQNFPLSYADIMDDLYEPQYLRWDDIAKATYLEIDNPSYENDHFVSYDDQQTIFAKANYIFDDDSLGGVILWELGGGYRKNLASGVKDSLLQAVKAAFLTTNAQVNTGWNMTSVPRVVSDFSVDAVYPTRTSGTSVFAFENNQYVSKNILINGPGYWVKFPSAQTIQYVGEAHDSFHVAVNPGWNIIGSIWDNLHTSKISTVGTNVISQYYGFNGNYYFADTIKAGGGYWVKMDSIGTLIIDRNAAPSEDQLPCTQPPPSPGGEPVAPALTSPSDGATGISITPTLNWNASSGADSYRLQVSANLSFNPTVYDQSGLTTTSKQVGPLLYNTTYYWRVSATNGNGTSLWSCPQAFRTESSPFDRFTIADASGKSQTLYTQPSIDDGIEMPPSPPPGIFDARFQSGNVVEGLSVEDFTNIPIVVSNAASPLTLSWEINLNNTSYWFIPVGALNDTSLWIPLTGSSSMQVSSVNGVIQLAARTQGSLGKEFSSNSLSEIPDVYSLEQSYPNPFNSQTIIRYQLPEESQVKLTVYDILGREIKVLVNEKKEPGYYDVNYDASNLASGIYVYRLETRNFTQSQKMILIK